MTADLGGGRPYGSLARIYDELLGRTAFECWLENFERITRRNGIEFSTAADIACGTGLAACYLAQRCDRVYAVDASREMLEVARERRKHDNIQYLQQSFVDLHLPERVDLLTCNFDSLNYLCRESDLLEALGRFEVSLVEGGWAVFDMNTCRQLEAGSENQVLVHRMRDAVSIWESTWDAESRTNTVLMTNFIGDGSGRYARSEEIHAEKAYDVETVLQSLLHAGFERVEALDAKDLGAIAPETRRVQFVARK